MGELNETIVNLDARGTVQWVSPDVRAMLGYEPDDVIGMQAAEFLPKRDVPDYEAGFPQIVSRPGATVRGVVSAVAADGRERRLEIVARNCLDVPQVHGIVAHCADVTSKHQAQQALTASRMEVEEACRMANVGAWGWNAGTNEVHMSRLLLDLLGWESQPALDWNELSPLYMHPEDLDKAVQALRGTYVIDDVAQTEHRVIRADGSVRLWAVRARCYRDEEGQIQSVLGTVMDVTQDRQREQELARARKLEALDLLSAGIAHDFNNLLAVILGNVSLARMEMGSEVNPTADKALFDAQSACQQAGRIAEQLFSFARGTMPEAFRRLELGRIVSDAVPFLLHGTRVQGDVDVRGPLPVVLGDAAQIGQAIQNFVLNAMAAMPEGGTLSAIAEAVELPLPGHYLDLPPGPYVRLTISDTGHGISSKYLDRIFDPYFTTRQEGHGMGLATTDRIIRGHGGRITVESEEGRGTTFRIFIPAAPSAAEAAATQDEVALGHPCLVDGTRILVLDDEDLLRTVTSELITRLGGRPSECRSSREAETLVREALADGDPFHAAIIDLTLPADVSGVEVLRRLKAIDPEIRSVLCSGYAHAKTVTTYHRMGFRVVLPKPFTPVQLESALNDALSRSPRIKGRRRTDRGRGL